MAILDPSVPRAGVSRAAHGRGDARCSRCARDAARVGAAVGDGAPPRPDARDGRRAAAATAAGRPTPAPRPARRRRSHRRRRRAAQMQPTAAVTAARRRCSRRPAPAPQGPSCSGVQPRADRQSRRRWRGVGRAWTRDRHARCSTPSRRCRIQQRRTPMCRATIQDHDDGKAQDRPIRGRSRALTAALKDTDKDVRETALQALVQMRDPGIFEPLVAGADGCGAGRPRAGRVRSRPAARPARGRSADPRAQGSERATSASRRRSRSASCATARGRRADRGAQGCGRRRARAGGVRARQIATPRRSTRSPSRCTTRRPTSASRRCSRSARFAIAARSSR